MPGVTDQTPGQAGVTDPAPEPAGEAAPASIDGLSLIKAVGLVLVNMGLYGPSHGVTVRSLEEALAILNGLGGQAEDIHISLGDEGLLVNGAVVEQKISPVQVFAARVRALDAKGFSIQTAIPRAEFESLLRLLSARPDEVARTGGFAATVAALGLQAVRTVRVTYQEVSEDEVVIRRQELEAEQQEARDAQTLAERIAAVKAVVNGTGEPGAEAVQDLREVAADAEALGRLILDAAREAAEGREDADAARELAACLKRVLDLLISDPTARTQKGKRAILANLNRLEKFLVEALRASGDAAAEAGIASVEAEVSEASDALQLESLAQEYVKKREALESNQGRVVRYLKAHRRDGEACEELRSRLTDAGLGDEAWRELLAKSGAVGHESGGADGGGTDGRTFERLKAAIDGLAGAGQGDGTPALAEAVQAVGREVGALLVQAEEKVEELVKTLAEESAAVKAGAEVKPMSRARLAKILAEIVQEIMQPITVVNTALEAIRSRMLGDVPAAQMELLNLAATSTERISQIAGKLKEIGGLPETMTPDAAIQSSLYA